MNESGKTNVEFKLDRDGFFTRECPTCEKRFKINPHEGRDKPLSFCPYCAHEGEGCWWTEEQIRYGSLNAIAPLMKEFEKSLKGLATVTKRRPVPETPDESKLDLPQVSFDCCNEIVKLAPQESYHCVICGEVQGAS